MADDLAAWLTQIWDEQEKAARAAFSNQADPEEGWGEDGRAVTPHVGVIHEDVQRAHVVAWHPGVVLARLAADRQILALHKHTADPVGWIDCGTCGEAGHEADKVKWCQHVRLLASPYADRPGYREEWRPE